MKPPTRKPEALLLLVQYVIFSGFLVHLISVLMTSTSPKTINCKKDETTIRGYETRPGLNYSWTGSYWYPPEGVPAYSTHQMRDILSTENTLWIGDSTARQDYHTMYHLVNALDLFNVPRGSLEQFINKGKKKPETFYIRTGRTEITNMTLLDAGQVHGIGAGSLSDMTDVGKLDLGPGIACLQSLLSNDINWYDIYNNYSILILSLGIWDIARLRDCDPSMNDPSERLTNVLNTLDKHSGPELYILWKNHGPGASMDAFRKSEKLNHVAKIWFLEHQPKYMDLVDFGGAVLSGNRTYGDDRITGDLRVHWGLEARLLSIQMITHALHMKQNQRNVTF